MRVPFATFLVILAALAAAPGLEASGKGRARHGKPLGPAEAARVRQDMLDLLAGLKGFDPSKPAALPEQALLPSAADSEARGFERRTKLIRAGTMAGPGQVDPIFHVRTLDPIGTVSIRTAPDRAHPGQHRCLMNNREGFLHWLRGTEKKIHCLLPNGGLFEIEVEHSSILVSLVKDARGQIWFFGDRSFGTINVRANPSDPAGETVAYDLDEHSLGAAFSQGSGPRCVAAGKAGELAAFSDQAMVVYRPSEGKALTTREDPADVPAAMAWEPTLQVWACVRPGRDGIYFMGSRKGVLPLEKGSRPQGITLGPDGRLWFTLSGKDQVGALDVMTSRIKRYPVAPPRSAPPGPLGPNAITAGPDGNLWVTLTSCCGIARITPDGGSSRSFLMPGQRVPLEIAPSHDGRLWVNLQGLPVLAAITALPQVRPCTPWERETSFAQAPETQAFKPRPEPARSRPSREERWARHEACLQRAEQHYQARLKLEAELGIIGQGYLGEVAGAPGDKAGPREEKKHEPERTSAAAPVPPAARMAAHRVYLTREALAGHIHPGHAHGLMPDKSQFSESCSTLESMEELLAQGIEQAGGPSDAGWWGDHDRYYLACRVPGAGSYHHYGKHYPTDQFLVVMDRYYIEAEDDYDHVVITAYPVAERW